MPRVAVRLVGFAMALAVAFGGAYALGDRSRPAEPPAHEMTPGETMP